MEHFPSCVFNAVFCIMFCKNTKHSRTSTFKKFKNTCHFHLWNILFSHCVHIFATQIVHWRACWMHACRACMYVCMHACITTSIHTHLRSTTSFCKMVERIRKIPKATRTHMLVCLVSVKEYSKDYRKLVLLLDYKALDTIMHAKCTSSKQGTFTSPCSPSGPTKFPAWWSRA